MKKIEYLIVFLLVVIIGLQGYYIYSSSHSATSDVKTREVQPVSPAKQMPMISLGDKDLDKFFSDNPFEQMQRMEQNMQKIFNSMNSQFAVMPEFEKFFKNDMSISPALNLKKYKDKYVLNVSMPGSDKDSIKIDAKDGILRIEAQTKRQKDENSSSFVKKEIFEGTFIRSLSLPKDADVEKMKTEYKNGVLKITLPRK